MSIDSSVLDALHQQANATTAHPAIDPGVLDAIHQATGYKQPSPIKKILKPLHQPVHNLGDALDYQHAAALEATFGKGSEDKNRAALRQKLVDWNVFRQGGYEQAPHWAQGTIDIGLDTLTDPLTYETLGANRLVSGARAVGRVAKPLLKYVPQEAKTVGTAVGHLLQDKFTYAGKAARAVGRSKVNEAVGLESRQAAMEPELERRLNAYDDQIMAGLSDREKSQVQRIMHGDLSGSRASPKVMAAVQGRRQLARMVPALQAQPGSGLETLLRFGSNPYAANAALKKAQRPLVQAPETLEGMVEQFRRESADYLKDTQGRLLSESGTAIRGPKNAAKFTLKAAALPAKMAIPQDLAEFKTAGQFTPRNLKKNYFPGPKNAALLSPDQEARTFNLLENVNPHLLHQDEFRIRKDEVQKFEDAWKGMLKTNARVITVNSLKQGLDKAFNGNVPADVRDLFERDVAATGAKRSSGQVVGDAWRGLVNLPRVGIVGTSPRHMVNILNLLVNAAPAAAPEAFAKFAKLVAMKDPGQRYRFLKEAIDMGIDAPFEDQRGLLTGRIFGPISKGINKATWDFDTAATWALAKHLLRENPHLNPMDAGQRARQLLVDYRHLSPATKKLKNISTFATFESQIPFAVLKGVARNPARAELLNRATGGQLYGGGDSKHGKYYGPTAKVGRGLLNPLEFTRGLLADPVRLSIAGAEQAAGRKRPYMNYDNPLDWRDALGAATSFVPQSRDILSLLGLSHFKPRPAAKQALNSATGVLLP